MSALFSICCGEGEEESKYGAVANPADYDWEDKHSSEALEQQKRIENVEKQILLQTTARKAEGRAKVFTAPLQLDNDYKPPVFEKTKAVKEFLVNALRDNFIFIDMTEDQRQMFINAMQPEHFEKGGMIIQMGDVGDFFYIVMQGTVNFVNTDDPAKPVVGSCEGGASFGELALLYDAPRQISCIAATPVDVYKVDQKTFRMMSARHSKDQHQDLRELIRGIQLFSNLDDNSLNRFTMAMAHVHWKTGDRIVQKGSEGNVFYIIQEGEVKVHGIGLGDSKFEDQVLKPGDWFGERALITGEPRAANVTAITPVTTLAIDRETFETTIGPLKDLMEVEMRKQVLKGIPLFARGVITEPEIDQLVGLMEEVCYRDGAHLATAGQPYEMNLWIIRHGTLLVLHDKTGKVFNLQSGDYFGDKSMRGEWGHISSHNAIVECDLTAWVLKRCDIENVIGDIEKLGEAEDFSKQHLDNKVLLKDLDKVKVVGQGGFGKVWLVRHTQNNSSYALKSISKYKLLESRQTESVFREKELLSLLKHPFIMRLIATYQDEANVYLLLPLIQGGDMFSVLQKQKVMGRGLTNDNAAFYIACVVEALGHFHQRSIAYRDLKLENVLVDSKGYCKIVDLGFAKVVTDKTYTLVGTPEYLAPEIIMSKGHDKAVDYWSMGVLLYELLCGVSPFHRPGAAQIEMFKRIVLAKYTVPEYVMESAKKVLGGLLQRNQMKRLGNLKNGYLDIKNHPWFEDSHLEFKELLKTKITPPWVPKLESSTDVSNFDDFSAAEKEIQRGPRLKKDEQDLFAGF